MSDTEHTEQPVEQITSEPKEVKKTKDPKKVAAGKRLAEYHKKAKEALKNKEPEEKSSSWMPEISFTTALSLVGITLTAVDLYFRWRKDKPKENVETKVQPSKIPVAAERPKYGMQ
jgi:hypothetical protein